MLNWVDKLIMELIDVLSVGKVAVELWILFLANTES